MTTTVSGSQITFNDNTTQNTSAYGGGFAFRNRIINGDMRIDQRNAGAATTNAISGYVVDRWSVLQTTTGKLIAQQNAGAVTPPAGFTNYFGVTSQSAYTVGAGDIYRIAQDIEGYNIADLSWGTTNAQPIVLSFWVRSSLTGTFGGAINAAAGRYAYTYTISSANTWEYKTISIPAPASSFTGWNVTNGSGFTVIFGLGVGSTYSGTAGSWTTTNYQSATGATSVVGTNGATFYITGVQLEKGSTATSFDYRPYGQELALCQRYCFVNKADYAYSGFVNGALNNGNEFQGILQYPVQMRTSPSLTSSGNFESLASGVARSATLSTGGSEISSTTVTIKGSLASSGTQGNAALLRASNDSTAKIILSAEL